VGRESAIRSHVFYAGDKASSRFSIIGGYVRKNFVEIGEAPVRTEASCASIAAEHLLDLFIGREILRAHVLR